MIKINIKDIYNLCNEKFPFDKALEFDNSGILLNNIGAIKKVYIALDLTTSILEKAINYKANLIITHHPFIFEDIREELKKKWKSKIWNSLKKNNIALIAMHTNCDVSKQGLNKQLADKLDIKKPDFFNKDNIGLIGNLKKEIKINELINKLKTNLNLENVKFSGNLNDDIKKIAIVGGSGGEYFIDAYNNGADLFISSEIKWHQFIYAKELNLNMIDISHDIEKIFGSLLEKILIEKNILVMNDLETIKFNYY